VGRDVARLLPRPGRFPDAFLLLAALAAAGALLPLGYLLLRVLEADWTTLGSLLARPRNLQLLGNTLALTAGVLAVDTALALPLAWLLSRTELAARRSLTVLAVLPLAVPGYVMALALLGLGGAQGMLARAFGIVVPRPSGYVGALVCIALYTFPYVFLNVRTALLGMDPSHEEAARSLGCPPRGVVLRVVLPQLRPALLASWLVVGLYTLGDFGAVSLMRYETFSFAIYLQYAGAFDRTYAAGLALVLLALALVPIAIQGQLLRGRAFHRTGPGSGRPPVRVPLGRWRVLAWAFLGLVYAVSLGLPVGTLVYWLWQRPLSPQAGRLAASAWGSLSVALPVAAAAAVWAVPLAYRTARKPGRISQALEGAAYLGYATPPFAVGLGWVFFGLRGLPWLYQTLPLLVVALALHFLAVAAGPVRSALAQAPPRLEEAARALGYGPVAAFARTTLPLILRGTVAGAALVFLLAVKELPITFLLAPPGFSTLATQVFASTSEALFAQAAPFALALVALSAPFVGLVIRGEVGR
jgi:iron(III) transport system permease protein